MSIIKTDPHELLTPEDVETIYRIPKATQKCWRWRTKHTKPGNPGLPFLKLGGSVRYRRSEIEKWVGEQEAKSQNQGISEAVNEQN